MVHSGSCYCGKLKYELDLGSPDDDARTSICHCRNCRKWTGSAFGITTMVPRTAFRFTAGESTENVGDNGSGVLIHREFCGACGSGILEYGENAGGRVYVTYGTLDDPAALPPKGEFFCKDRAGWLPEIPGLFRKQEIKT
ncbi:MAG: hypothetical protein M1813_002132 [Trichoglossum hirsutum]|nr:MAG: hypothetical protein M1813_002132 [Trichoglossum hirsutum]